MSQKSSIQLQLSGNQLSQLQFALASVQDIKNLLKDQNSYKQLNIYKQQVLHRDG